MVKYVILSLVYLLLSCSFKEEKIVNFFNWGEYLDEEVLIQFTKETGIKVNYEVYGTNEEMYIRLNKNPNYYDIIVPSGYMVERLIQENKLYPLNFKKIPNVEYIIAGLQKTNYDPDARYSIPYFWSTWGIAYDSSKVSLEELQQEQWGILWNAEYKNQITMMDSHRDNFAVAALKLGLDLNSVDPEVIAQLKKELIAQKSVLMGYYGDGLEHIMARGEMALGLAYLGDTLNAMDINPNLNFYLPDKAYYMVDAFVMPKDAPHKEEALALINFLSKPEIAFKNYEYIAYLTPNSKVLELVDEDKKNNPMYYPTEKRFNNLTSLRHLGQDIEDLYNNAWIEVQAE